MDAGEVLRQARREAGFSQRGLARAAHVPQATVARIETGVVVPRLDTIGRLLEVCGRELTTVLRAGRGVDRTQIAELLEMSARERMLSLVRDAANLDRLLTSARRS